MQHTLTIALVGVAVLPLPGCAGRLERDQTVIEELGGTADAVPATTHDFAIVSLQGSRVTDSDLRVLVGYDVRHLDLRRTRVTDAGMRFVARLANLEVLDIGETAVGDAGLEALGGLSSLQRLHLSNSRVTTAGVEELRSQITGLVVIGHETDPSGR